MWWGSVYIVDNQNSVTSQVNKNLNSPSFSTKRGRARRYIEHIGNVRRPEILRIIFFADSGVSLFLSSLSAYSFSDNVVASTTIRLVQCESNRTALSTPYGQAVRQRKRNERRTQGIRSISIDSEPRAWKKAGDSHRFCEKLNFTATKFAPRLKNESLKDK